MDVESELNRIKLELEEKSRLLEEALERERSRRRTSAPKKYYVHVVEERLIDVKSREVVDKYTRLADRIRADADARDYIDALLTGFLKGTTSKVFNALCVPSGTGKTQLAFSLPEEQCACIYLNMSLY